MTDTGVIVTLSPRDYDAVLFDLDGVLTRTASVHAAAWKKLFDDFLEGRAAEMGEPFVPFDIDTDYRRYVDGKPRYDGVAAFLTARSIELPAGTPEDGPGLQTVHALGSLKDQYFLEHLQRHGIAGYADSLALVQTLRAQDVKAAVVSSSNNCAAVLAAAGITQLFDARVDGRDISRLGFRGSRRPTRSWKLLGASGWRCRGRSSWRMQSPGSRRRARAASVASSASIAAANRERCARREPTSWSPISGRCRSLSTRHPNGRWCTRSSTRREGMRESLCALGNGYFDTRGAAAWAHADDVHYPGTYLGGGYNRMHHRDRRSGGRERRPGQLSQLARARVSHRRRGLVRSCRPSRSCRTARSSISAVASCCGPSASRTAAAGAARSASGASSRWATCTWPRSSSR